MVYWDVNVLDLLMLNFWNNDAQESGIELGVGVVAVHINGEVECAKHLTDQAFVDRQVRLLSCGAGGFRGRRLP